MQTDELIRAIVADNASQQAPIGRTLFTALLAGALGATVLFAVTLGLRADFGYSILHSPRFQFKFLFTLAVAVPALLYTCRLARPQAVAGGLSWMLAVPALILAAALAVEMVSLPADHWAVYAMGQNAFICMTMIPLFSIAPLAAMLYALRQGAPTRPVLAGAAAGLLAAGIGATLYASHCSDDSPLFVAIWYPAGIALVMAAGAALGRRFLKW